ncbi:alcohol dehydrogenase, putative [Entamoeba dispar SAW760]|uniref:Alcohol dehydrogenase, putative n=1 Tax=Entamoeba dispar (strain ATCC PRA-260 / SAW760) TaxID=370354 RepID=B0EJU2_ENTDS|nr:alcohol dehydrogenase, putative [Entamoeba dispar SAW760]EDR25210.1 alcohol dehydrogenase, putative [Entamoeba dispar SAW760]|eukprot:EDR25210.1 alcohol dehydrogenase, putative [Entamoeba dispar SAW760]
MTMLNFTYYNPVRLIYGKGSLDEIEKQHLIPEDARIMMTYGGGSIKKNGVYEEVMKHIKPIIEFGGIEPNPSHETCIKAIKIAKENQINFFVAVGGGSIIDATKYIALGMEHTYSNDPYDICIKKREFKVNPAKAKIGVILTIPATGSEMNCWGVISRHSDKQKLSFSDESIFPTWSIVDPCFTMSLPDNQIRNGLVDSFVHCIEQYIGNYHLNPVVEAEAEGVMRTIIAVSHKTIENHQDYQARITFCYAATVALNTTLLCGVQLCGGAHAIGHEITNYYGLAHGETLAITTLGVMRFNKEKNRKKIIQMGEQVFGIKNSTAEATIEAIEKWFKSIGMKTKLSEWGKGKEEFENIARKFEYNPVGAHKDIDYKGCLQILNDIY